ncbi:hypothetical protein NMQ03_05360 [Arthrobacter sp. DNA4]|uniref:hypothetical protein n=1 Tax=Arthrobacter sp. DNA4 TaxID=2963432 RepID=UPI0020CE8277|nr:hypothetical protein [Arthrobacter sp. DNA4]UTT70567.1 hypothetical protein NMQ03_05360 [Arthrobacter sp. DNA4]
MVTQIWPQHLPGVSSFSFYYTSRRAVRPTDGHGVRNGAAVGVCHETLAALYDYFIPYPIEKLHTSNRGRTLSRLRHQMMSCGLWQAYYYGGTLHRRHHVFFCHAIKGQAGLIATPPHNIHGIQPLDQGASA